MNEETKLPSIEDKPAAPKPTSKKKTTKKAKPAKQPGVEIVVPVSDAAEGYSSTRIDVQGLNSRQATALKRLERGLCDASERLADGSIVNNRTKAIKWLLEQINP